MRNQRWLALTTVAVLLVLGGSRATVQAQGCGMGGCGAGGCSTGGCSSGQCGFHCQRFHCPPCFRHCMERPPKLHYSCGCPRPVCNPCNLPHYGYFQTCWRPWPFPEDWSHCPVQGPQAYPPVGPPPPLAPTTLGNPTAQNYQGVPSATTGMPAPATGNRITPGL